MSMMDDRICGIFNVMSNIQTLFCFNQKQGIYSELYLAKPTML